MFKSFVIPYLWSGLWVETLLSFEFGLLLNNVHFHLSTSFASRNSHLNKDFIPTIRSALQADDAVINLTRTAYESQGGGFSSHTNHLTTGPRFSFLATVDRPEVMQLFRRMPETILFHASERKNTQAKCPVDTSGQRADLLRPS